MLAFLAGVVCLWGCVVVARGGRTAHAYRWAVAIGVIALVQVWWARADIRHYRFELLGLRFRISAPSGGTAPTPVRIGGDPATTEVDVVGAERHDVAWLRGVGDSSLRAVVVELAPDADAAVILSRKGEERILGARPASTGDTIVVLGADPRRLVIRSSGPFWKPDRIVENLSTGKRVVLPGIDRSWRDRLQRFRRPSRTERTYPLADVLDATGDSRIASSVPLTSFFYFGDCAWCVDRPLFFANLDSEVERAAPAVDTVWRSGGEAAHIIVAGVPRRDFTSLRDSLPGRGGLRTLLSVQPRVRATWLDLTLATPEVVSADTRSLHELDARAGGDTEHDDYTIRFSGVKETRARRALTFSTPPKRFEGGSQAVFRLPRDPTDGSFQVVTPTGIAAWTTGTPFTLGDGERQEIMRIVGSGTSWSFWLAVVLMLLVVPAALFRGDEAPSSVAGLALAAFGLATLRVLVSWSASVESPFAAQAAQSGPWLVPLLPWAVLAVAAATERRRSLSRRDVRLVLWGVGIAALALVLFHDDDSRRPGARELILAAVPLALSALIFVRRQGVPARLASWGRAALDRSRSAGGRAASACRQVARLLRVDRLVPVLERHGLAPGIGAALGVALFVARMFFFVFAHHESITIGSTRLALSILYTPLVILALAWTIARRARDVVSADADRARGMAFRRLVVDVWLLLFFAFDLTAVFVSDLGVALATQFGALIFLLIFAWRWVPPATNGVGPYAALILPLVMSLVPQLRPTVALTSADPDQLRYEYQDWSANDLRLLAHGNPGAVRLIGQRRSEAVGIMRATMAAYVGGPFLGAGYFRGVVSEELRATATREHAPSALIVGQWGLLGALGLFLLLVSLVVSASSFVAQDESLAPTRWLIVVPMLAAVVLWALTYLWPFGPPWGLAFVTVVALAAVVLTLGPAARRPLRLAPAAPTGFVDVATDLVLFTLAFSGVYMLLANFGTLLFTGKNVYFFGLDSLGDLLEGLVLLAGAAWGLSVRDRSRSALVRT